MTAQLGPIHHVAIVVHSIEASLPRYRALFGLEPEVAPFVFAAQHVRLCFLPTGPEPAARIELVELQPYPFISRPIAPGDYRVTLTVTRP